MKISRIGVPFLAAIVALAAVGMSYAQWSETLTIHGSVAMTDLDVRFTEAWTNDEANNDPGLLDITWVTDTAPSGYWDTYPETGTYDRYSYDIARTYTTVTTTNEDEPRDTLTITMDGAYNSYAPCVHFKVKNTGGVPVVLTDLLIEYGGYSAEWAGKQLDRDGVELIAWEVTYDDGHVIGKEKGTYTWNINPLNAGDESAVGMMLLPELVAALQSQVIEGGHFVDVHLVFHIGPDVAENGLIEFDLLPTFEQWNLHVANP